MKAILIVLKRLLMWNEDVFLFLSHVLPFFSGLFFCAAPIAGPIRSTLKKGAPVLKRHPG